MKKGRLLKIITVVFLIFSLVLPSGGVCATAESTGEYDYILNTFEENAYVIFGENIEANNCEFYDGIAQGVTDKESEFYNENSQENGMSGRKFYKGNNTSVRINDDFYEKDDHEFLVSVAYYDYGPSEGRIFFEYFPQGSTESKQVTIIKSGKVQDWFVKTFYINDMELDRYFESGANARLVTGAWNLFKKLEIVNISKLKREKAAARATLASAKRDSLIKMGVLDGTDSEFVDKNLNESCTERTANMLLNIISGRNKSDELSKYSDTKTMTQGELLKLYGAAVGARFEDDDICSSAKNLGLVYDEDLFFSRDAVATNYNLLALANNTLIFARADNSSLATDLLDAGILNEKSVCQSGEEKLIAAVFRTPQPCPYTKVLDNETGQMFNNMSIYGLPTMRPYVTTQSWTEDGKRFLCSLTSGEMFLYDTEKQTLKYVDTSVTEVQRLHATVGTDDYIYYSKKKDGEFSIWRADANAELIKPEHITDAPPRSWISVPQLSNDCNYISVDYTDNAHDFSKPGDRTFARYNIKDKKWEVYVHNFTYGNVLTHNQINPEYPNILSFCHEIEGSGLSSVYDILDRMWIFDCDTKEAKCMYAQGVNEHDGGVLQGATHEVWSNDGQYMYFINYSTDPRREVGLTPSAVRFNLDGSHRQYYYDDRCPSYLYQHLYATTDNKYIVADGNYVVLICTETNQHFPITHFAWNVTKSHPYQAHPVIARNRYVVSWGAADDRGLLCVRWFDFSNLAKKQAKGGHYNISENVDRVSYTGLDCESSEKTVMGKKSYFAKSGRAVYLDIKEKLLDTDDGAIKLSFDYLDNGVQPISVTYTSGVKSDNERWRVFDNVKTVKRSGTDKWKHCDIIIESGNFENIGTYSTDLKIDGAASNIQIANVTAELVS